MTKLIESNEELVLVERIGMMDIFNELSIEDLEEFKKLYPREKEEYEKIISVEGEGYPDFIEQIKTFTEVYSMGFMNEHNAITEDYMYHCNYSKEDAKAATDNILAFEENKFGH